MELLNINITTEDLVRGIGRDAAMDVIKKIDLNVAEVGFTLELIKNLIQSLEKDMSKEEIYSELKYVIT